MTPRVYSPVAPQGEYAAPVADGPVDAALTIPGSKSLTNRELILAALAEAPSRLISPLQSDDSRRMVEGLKALGVVVEEVEGESPFGPDLLVHPATPFTGGATVDCGQAGTVMRFLAPLAGLAQGDVLVTAHESALHRPMAEMIRAMRDLGVDIDDGGHWSLPFTVKGHGRIRGGEIAIDASASSQFVSGLLLAAPRFDVGLHLRHTGDRLPSIPHIDMTVEALARRGVHVERPAAGEWIVPASPLRAKDIAIEPDLSNAAPFLAAAMVTGGSVTIAGWPPHSTQPGAQLADILQLMGGRVSRRGGALTVAAGRGIHGLDLDLSAVSELTPTLVGLAVFADSPTTFHGIAHIRGHETDRIAALAENVKAIGGEATELPDGIRIIPPAVTGKALTGGVWGAYHDHRMATTGALIGLRVPGVVIDDIGTTAKTLPQFTQLWDQMLGR
ncbi:3-phosphoshikimate 1-carboxyvinyltransferase [Microbacterium stercoris]|uniref:3-phosphoshikimate 1-carboxyvinyltransferase n=1 Tax=Microbacterium stercoris TaxID=2820289 RepID=A0A939QQE0_9MICO|nr:3-phosphoshikimate 1-carboxyvinyltransferase [Microbacterium stercoris]MBO3664825.1 3-phosphoshikimate 1-carboxyvinyltransferase [Microbacterium stercoris]